MPPPPRPDPRFEVVPPNLPQQRPQKKVGQGGLIGILAAIGVVMAKFSGVLLVLFKMGGSMLLSIGAYSLLWGWKFAAGFVVLIFVHEMGHFIVGRLYGIPTSAPMFIPFMGAYVTLKERPQDPFTNAVISWAGPAAGALGGWVCLNLALAFGVPWMMAVALYTFFINAFNLLPIPALDGSHLWICLSPKSTPTMRPWQRVAVFLLLAGVIATLGYGYWQAQQYLHYFRTHH